MDILSDSELQTLILNLITTRSRKGGGAHESDIAAFISECEKLAIGWNLLQLLLRGDLGGDLIDGELVFEKRT